MKSDDALTGTNTLGRQPTYLPKNRRHTHPHFTPPRPSVRPTALSTPYELVPHLLMSVRLDVRYVGEGLLSW